MGYVNAAIPPAYAPLAFRAYVPLALRLPAPVWWVGRTPMQYAASGDRTKNRRRNKERRRKRK